MPEYKEKHSGANASRAIKCLVVETGEEYGSKSICMEALGIGAFAFNTRVKKD